MTEVNSYLNKEKYRKKDGLRVWYGTSTIEISTNLTSAVKRKRLKRQQRANIDQCKH